MGKRVEKLEKFRRIMSIKEWMLMGWDTAAIVSQGESLWGLSDRQIYRYIGEADEQFQKEIEKSYNITKARHLAARDRLLRNLKYQDTPKGASTALKILDSKARIDGILKDKVEHEHTLIKVIRK